MIVYPNAKINIGLDILFKRNDGFHELETLMVPISLCDELSIEENPSENETRFSSSGIIIDGKNEDNIVYKAYHLLAKNHHFPALKIHLRKNIPFGAGLGGGSADASFLLTTINAMFNLNISTKKLEEYAGILGSDCPLFIQNKPALACGRGEILEPFPITLTGKHLVVVIPDLAISTKAAYSLVKPSTPKHSLKNLLKEPLTKWKENIKNDFEYSVFEQFKPVALTKQRLYEMGAQYASLSGSGAAVFGIFDQKPLLTNQFPTNYFIWQETML